MIKPFILLLYTFQLFLICIHLYPSSRHIYMILVGLLLHKCVTFFLCSRLRFLLGTALIFIYLQFPFLYFLSYSYILSNTYYTTSLLIKSTDISHIVYYIEISGCILSFLVHVDYSIIYLLALLDIFLIYFKISPPHEEKRYQDVINKIKYVINDYQIRKKEYRLVLSNYTCTSVLDDRNYKDHLSLEHSQDLNHNIIEETECYKKNLKKSEDYTSFISLDFFTPLILFKKDMYSFLLLILRVIPSIRTDYFQYLFIFLFLIEYELISLIISLLCDHSNTKNITSRMIFTVLIYYFIKNVI